MLLETRDCHVRDEESRVVDLIVGRRDSCAGSWLAAEMHARGSSPSAVADHLGGSATHHILTCGW